MIPTQKKTIFIPIEIKNRELFGHLQLASEAVDRGYRVILGNKPLIYEIIYNKPNKDGFLLYKGGGRYPELILSLSKKLNGVGILDQELGVAVRDLKDFFLRRYDPKIISSIDKFYFLGKRYLEAAKKYSDIPVSKMLITGWPRVDVWRDRKIWQDQADNLKHKYGDYILFSSDFGVNSEYEVKERAKRSTAWTHQKTNSFFEENLSLAEERFSEFLAMVEILKKISKISGCPKIIVRPHYAENYEKWKEAMHGVENVEVINEGAITPWLLGSIGLLHSGCTTAFEARLFKIKTAHFLETSKSAADSYPALISEPLNDIQDFKVWLSKDVSSLDLTSYNEYADIGPISAAAKIMNDLDNFFIGKENFPEKPKISLFVKIGRRMPDFLKSIYSRINFIIKNPGLRPLADYRQKMPGGITPEECEFFLEKLRDGRKNFNLVKLEKDLIVIE